MQKRLSKIAARLAVFGLVAGLIGAMVPTAMAASVTALSDNMSRLKASTASNHTIQFTTPTGVASGQTVTMTFSSDFTGVSGIAFGDVDFATGASCGALTEQTVAATPSGATWGAASAGQVVTITSGTGTVSAGGCIRIKIGTNAVNGVTGTNQITNGAVDDDDTVSIAGSFGDTGLLAVDIITDDQVVVTAQVDPSITFTISDNTIGFGSLNASDDRFATGDTLGSSTTVTAHNLTAGTNATSGYIVYLLGGTLTSGANTITAPAGPAASTLGSEQFGVRYTASGGSGTVDTQYGTASQYGWGATATVQDNIASSSGPSATTTYNAEYIANIASSTEAGAYSTTLTYTATATY